MKLAVIAPTKYLKDFSSQGDCHMVLAHLVLSDAKYCEYYAKETKYKILDNGLFENGKGLMYDDLLKAAEMVKADEVILRDVLLDGDATLKEAEAMMRHFDMYSTKNYAFMYVPQASNIKDWLQSYREAGLINNIRTIGLSKLSIPHCWKMPISEARVACIKRLFERGIFAKNKVHHLLGGSNDVYSEIETYNKEGYSRWIQSIDSSAAYCYGKSGLALSPVNGVSKEIKTKVDFKDKAVDFVQCCLINENIQALKEVCHDS